MGRKKTYEDFSAGEPACTGRGCPATVSARLDATKAEGGAAPVPPTADRLHCPKVRRVTPAAQRWLAPLGSPTPSAVAGPWPPSLLMCQLRGGLGKPRRRGRGVGPVPYRCARISCSAAPRYGEVGPWAEAPAASLGVRPEARRSGWVPVGRLGRARESWWRRGGAAHLALRPASPRAALRLIGSVGLWGTEFVIPFSPCLSLLVPGCHGRWRPREVERGVARAAPAELRLESGGIWAYGLVSQCELPLGPTCSAIFFIDSIACFSLRLYKLTVCVFYVYCCGDFLSSSEHCHYCDFR